ncbi:MAG: restriction endonuclease [Flavobacteriales bacterium]|nr:restriction endonuclease [Flavobacteriales bacterium]
MSANAPLQVTKASGEMVPFSVEKLASSLHRAGATREVSEAIANEVLPKLRSGISTKKLYRLAFSLLHHRSQHLAARYRLKQAILDLGPSGFPFERFIARILEHDGYRTKVGAVVQGKCVKHEIDVTADLGDQRFMVECKYHNQPGRICDVKVPLYIHARFQDVEQHVRSIPGNGVHFDQGWLVTNTRFTGDAMRYGQCAGLLMISWDYPAKGSLKDRIDRSGLYPITCLSSLTKAEKERLLELGIVLCRDIVEDPRTLRRADVRPQRIGAVLKEGTDLCAQLELRRKK